MSLRCVATAAVLAALLGGCALGPDYARPALETPERFRAQADAGAAGSFGDLGWWEVYRDPTLSRLLAAALQRNLDVRIAAARVDQARAALGVARIGQLPNVSGNGNGGRSKLSSASVQPGVDRQQDQYAASVDVSWELDLWGRLRRLKEAARAEYLSTEYAREGVVATLVSDVATAYFTLIALDEQLRVTEATLNTREQFLQLTQAQAERGVVSGLDVSAAEAQLATARANVPRLQQQIAQTENALSLLLGGNPGEVLRERLAPQAAFAPEVPAGLPSALIDRRPDLRQSEQALVSANARVGAAKAALFPSISLTGSIGSLSGELSDLFKGPNQTWSAGVGLLQPLLDADRNLYQVDLADAAKREALLGYEQSVRNAFREVADALEAQRRTREVEQAQLAVVRALARSEEIAMARYKVGYSSYFDVINADRDLFGAKLDLSSARLDALLASVQLYKALGGGWQPPQP